MFSGNLRRVDDFGKLHECMGPRDYARLDCEMYYRITDEHA